MTSYIKYIPFYLSSFLLLSACDGSFFTTTLDDEAPQSEPQMAIHAFLTEGDSFLLASVTRTYGVLDEPPADELLSGAEVEVYENGNLLATLEERNIGFRPVNYINALSSGLEGQGKEYELIVRHPEFGEVRATQQMPTEVPLTSARFERNLGVNRDGDRLNGVSITLDDPAGIDNYYEVSIFTELNDQANRTFRLFIETVDPTVQEGYEGFFSSGNTLLIDGTSFDGQSVDFDLLSYNMDTIGQELYVNWRCISREMYRYSRTLFLVKDQAIEDNPFASPVSVFSNIDGGLGVFGSRTQTYVDVD